MTSEVAHALLSRVADQSFLTTNLSPATLTLLSVFLLRFAITFYKNIISLMLLLTKDPFP
jgi:hypothetical protein